jgi:acyl-coenzyme A synthetase/AMP-(fatty) acid ligase
MAARARSDDTWFVYEDEPMKSDRTANKQAAQPGRNATETDPLEPYGIGGQPTCCFLAQHARTRPSATAVIVGTRAVSYRQLASDVLSSIDAMRAAGVRPAQTIGVALPEIYGHLVVLLAAEALQTVSISLSPSEVTPQAPVVALCDRLAVATLSNGLKPNAQMVIRVPQNGRAPPKPLAPLEQPADPEALVRLIRSSGTTGVPKVMSVTHRVQDRSMANNLLHAAANILPRPHFLCLYPFSVRGVHTRAMLTLRLGGTVQFTGLDLLATVLDAGIGTYALFLSGELERLLRTQPIRRRPDLHIDIIGSAIPARLRAEIGARLTERIVVTYGANEVHHVSLVNADNVGTLFPGVQARITNQSGAPVSPGESGLIWLRTNAMTEAYVGAAELTRRTFVDGWYRTDDIGYQPAPETLVVLGRSDGMLNVGGLKLAPDPIVARLRDIPGIEDALLTNFDDSLETGAVLIALQARDEVVSAPIAEQVDAVLRPHVRFYHLLWTTSLPRTATGKVQAAAVKELYRERSARL